MGTVSAGRAAAARAREGLRRGALAMVILLIAQYVFGMWTNLYATIPAADRRTGLVTAEGKALTNPPAELAAHAGIGLLLFLLALALLIWAAVARSWFFLAVCVVGLGCITGAGLNGAAFVSTNANVHSLVMAMLWAGALLVFVTAVFVTGHGVPRAPRTPWRP